MNFLAVLFALFSVGACGVYEANLYLDTVLGVVLPLEVGKANLSAAAVPGFTVRARASKLLVQFDAGVLHGLAGSIERQGDCEASRWEAGNLTMRCRVVLDGMRLAFQGSAHGEGLPGDHSVVLVAVLRNSSANVTATEAKGHRVQLKIDLGDLNLVLAHSTDLDVKNVPKNIYNQQLLSTARSILERFLVTTFLPDVLSEAFSKIHLPLPQ